MIDDRILKMLSLDKLNKIKSLKVLIVGVGGVGSYALEALVRSGVLNIIVIDGDKVDSSNLNRQNIALKSCINKSKVDVAKNRMLDIRDDLNITCIDKFLMPDDVEEVLNNLDFDYIIDACDTVTVKASLISYAKKYNKKIITSLGTGNRLDPTMLSITKLNKSYNDPLGNSLRNILRDKNIDLKVDVLWSKELPIKTKDRTPGSMMFVPSSAGILIASYIIRKEIDL